MYIYICLIGVPSSLAYEDSVHEDINTSILSSCVESDIAGQSENGRL